MLKALGGALCKGSYPTLSLWHVTKITEWPSKLKQAPARGAG
jgi:hypothetical protein